MNYIGFFSPNIQVKSINQEDVPYPPMTYPIPECYERQESKDLTHRINEETEAQRG